jgi:hypothetical protein
LTHGRLSPENDEATCLKEFAVTEVFIRFPVNCPVCKQEWTSHQTKRELLDALDNNKPIRVYAECHDWHWDLNEAERKELAARVRV